MPNIIVTTDFSASSYNALKYARSFQSLAGYDNIVLLNVFTIPAADSAEGISLVAVNESLLANVSRLKEEIDWLNENEPDRKIIYKEVMGGFVATLKQQIIEENAGLVIMGTPSGYGEIWQWGADVLDALTLLHVPVLTVPLNASFKQLQNIGFAYIPENINANTQLSALTRLIKRTCAKLHVVTVSLPGAAENSGKSGETVLHEMLKDIEPEYHKIYAPHVVAAIGNFATTHNIDLLFVQPRKHGIWYNLFHKSYSKELAKLNLIPVMAIH